MRCPHCDKPINVVGEWAKVKDDPYRERWERASTDGVLAVVKYVGANADCEDCWCASVRYGATTVYVHHRQHRTCQAARSCAGRKANVLIDGLAMLAVAGCTVTRKEDDGGDDT